jgi:hypothetical protein
MPVDKKTRAIRRLQPKIDEAKQNYENSPLNNICSWDIFARLSTAEMRSIQSVMKEMVKMKSKQEELELDNDAVVGAVPPKDIKWYQDTDNKKDEKEKENIILKNILEEKEKVIISDPVPLPSDKRYQDIDETENNNNMVPDNDEEHTQYLLIKDKDVHTDEEFEIYLKHHTRDGMPLSDDDKLFLREMQGCA